MLLQGTYLMFLFLGQALPLPLTTQLSREDEKVIKCISEILADALSRPSPIPVTQECVNILREDERVLAMLHHWHLLTELENLTHQENAKHHLDPDDSHDSGGKGKEEQEELKKKDQLPQEKEVASEKREEHTDGREKEEKEMEEYEKTDRTKEKVNVFQGEDLLETSEEQKEEEEGEEEEEEEEIRKKKSSSETWSSKEYFGHIKKRGSRQPKIRKGMMQDQDGQKRHGMVKRPLGLNEEEDGDSSEEEPKKDHHEGFSKDHHHEAREEERRSAAKRVAEKASDEETAQFEEEEKAVKISNSKENLHGGWMPRQEEAEEEEESKDKARHGRPDKPVGLDLKRRHWKDDVYVEGRHRAPDEEEEGREAGLSKAHELEKLEEIERQLRWAAAKLEELKQG